MKVVLNAGSQPRRVSRLNQYRSPPSPAPPSRGGETSAEAIMASVVGRGTKGWLHRESARHGNNDPTNLASSSSKSTYSKPNRPITLTTPVARPR